MKRIWFPLAAALMFLTALTPFNALAATPTYTFHEIDMSGVFNSDAYTNGQNYTAGTYYHRYPGTIYSDPIYGDIPMDMREGGQLNVWLSRGLGRTNTLFSPSQLPSKMTLHPNIQNAAVIWLAGFDAGWGGSEAPVEVKYKLDGVDTTLTYTPNDWTWDGTGDANLVLWVDHNNIGSTQGDISVARIVLPHTGYLTEITVTDPDTIYWGKSFPIFAVTVAAMDVDVDIKPGSSVNPFNVTAKGVLPVAILSTAELDATGIDPESIELEGVSPLRWAFEDVGTAGDPEAGPDGIVDLTLKFDSQEIAGAIGSVADGDTVALELTGNFSAAAGGNSFRGEDQVVIINKKSK